MTLRPEDYLKLTRLSDDGPVFLVGVNESHVTVLSQQQRALNLAYALDAALLRKRRAQPVGIVGAGFAGVTVAAALASLGYDVTIYEMSSRLIPVQWGCEKRHVDPHIYDWPATSWKRSRADLPMLSWEAGSAADVRAEVLSQFKEVQGRPTSGKIDIRFRTAVTGIDGARVALQDLERREFDTATHSAVVLAFGFGEERTLPGLHPYWHDDDLGQSFASQLSVHISGTGDGALVDALRVGITDFTVSGLRERLESAPAENLREEIQSFDEGSATGAMTRFIESLESLDRRQKQTKKAQLRQMLLGDKRADTSLELSGSVETPWSGAAFSLNRLLIYLLSPQYVRNRYESHEVVEGKINIRFQDGSIRTCARLVLRHGPKAHAENDLLLWAKTKHGEKWSALGALDLTRRAIYVDGWIELPGSEVLQPTNSSKGRGDDDIRRPDLPLELSTAQVASVIASTQQVQNARLRLQLPRPIVPEAFVSLSLSSLPENSSGGDKLLGAEFLSLAELLLPHQGNVLLTGGAGAGKSTLAQYIAHCALLAPGRVGLQTVTSTMFLNLPQVVESGGPVSAQICAALSLGSAADTWSPDSVERFLASRQPRLVVLDALDEVPAARERELAHLFARLRAEQVRTVVTCRNASLSRFSGLLANMLQVWIRPLTEYEVSEFASAQLGDGRREAFLEQWREYGQHHNMVTPLLVMMALVTFLRDGALPVGRAALYREYVGILLSEAQARRGRAGSLPAETFRVVSEDLAQASAEEFGSLDPTVAARRLRKHLQDMQLSASDALQFLHEDVGILERFGARLRFAHSSFFEYFLAHHVAQSLERKVIDRHWLAQRWTDRKYSEAIVFSVEIALAEGIGGETILKEIAEATQFVEKGQKVSDASFEDAEGYVFGGREEEEWDDYYVEEEDDDGHTPDGVGGADEDGDQAISAASEAIAYVVRCGTAQGRNAATLDVEEIGKSLMDVVVSWFSADYRDRTNVRLGALEVREGIHELLVRICRMGAAPCSLLRLACVKPTSFGRGTCLRFASAIAAATGTPQDAALLAKCLTSRAHPESGGGYEVQSEEQALSILYEVDRGAETFSEVILSRLEYWEPLSSQSDVYEKLLQLAMAREPRQLSAKLGVRLLSFGRLTERRTRLLFKEAPSWATSLVLNALKEQNGISFDEIDIVVELWGSEVQRSQVLDVLNEALANLELDSNAMDYLLSTIPELTFSSEEEVKVDASDPEELETFPHGRLSYSRGRNRGTSRSGS